MNNAVGINGKPDEAARTTRRETVAIAAVILVGAAARLWLLGCFWDQPLHIGDEMSFDALATNILTRHDFCDAQGIRTSERPPLYPAFLAGVYAACGVGNHNAVRVAQLGLGLVLTGLVHQLAKGMYSPRVGRWAAAICFLYPSLLVFSNLLLTEVLFAVLVCLACLAMRRFLRTGRVADVLLVGVLLGLAALTRSVLWLFVPFLVGFVFFAAPSPSWRCRLGLAVVPAVAFAVILTPWAVRNTRLQETFTVIEDAGGRNFMMGNYEHTPLYRTWDAIGVVGEKSWHAVLASETPGYEQLTQGQRDKLAMRRGLAFALANPALTAKRCFIKFLNFWQLERTVIAGMTRGFWGTHGRAAMLAATAAIFGGYALAIVSGVFGFVVLPPQDRRMHWFLLLLIGHVCAVHTVVFGHSRYHLALMPLVFVYSGAALSQLGEIARRRCRWAFWIASAIACGLVASWIWETFFVELPRLKGQM
ncbi:MAG: glycosyltransferase family 39 protein [Pirellulales bacterium]|nr:glycosyltransferase family 39 protein [Pirellulales bacterium]